MVETTGILKNQSVTAQITHSASCLAQNKLSTNDYCCLCDGDDGVKCFYTVFLEIKKEKQTHKMPKERVPESIQMI